MSRFRCGPSARTLFTNIIIEGMPLLVGLNKPYGYTEAMLDSRRFLLRNNVFIYFPGVL